MANTYGDKGIGIILTGMGKDGVKDLMLMRQRGALTVAQAEDGCLMYSMPKEAIESGAATYSAPLPEIPIFISKIFSE
jgi:two-component system chemotaxis response regulator CheB